MKWSATVFMRKEMAGTGQLCEYWREWYWDCVWVGETEDLKERSSVLIMDCKAVLWTGGKKRLLYPCVSCPWKCSHLYLVFHVETFSTRTVYFYTGSPFSACVYVPGWGGEGRRGAVAWRRVGGKRYGAVSETQKDVYVKRQIQKEITTK